MKLARIACAGLLLLAGAAAAQDGGKAITKTTISLGTATPGGGFPVYGNAFAEIMNAADPALSIEPRNTKGSNENIPLLESDQLDIALVAGEPSYEAFMGIGRAPTKLKILTAMYSSPGMFVVRADSPYKTIRDLVGQPVAFGAKGSGLPILSRYMLDGIGLKQDEDFKSIYLDRAGDGPAMVQDGRAAALWGAGVGWPGFAAMAQAPGGARFIAPDAGEIARIRAKHTFLKPLTVPANSYPNQTGGDQFRRLLEFCARARKPAGRRRLPAGAHAARGRGRAVQEAAAGLRDHGREHGCGRAECGADPSRRDEVFSRDRGGEVTASIVPGRASMKRALRTGTQLRQMRDCASGSASCGRIPE